MAKVKFPSEMPSANNIGGNDKMMIAKEGTGETYQATFDQAKRYLTIEGQRLPPASPGALSAGPPDATRYMVLTQPGAWTFGGNTFNNIEGHKLTLWWDPITGWQNAGSIRIKGDTGSSGANGKTIELFNTLKPGGYAIGSQVAFNEMIWEATANTMTGESPATHPSKWGNEPILRGGITLQDYSPQRKAFTDPTNISINSAGVPAPGPATKKGWQNVRVLAGSKITYGFKLDSTTQEGLFIKKDSESTYTRIAPENYVNATNYGTLIIDEDCTLHLSSFRMNPILIIEQRYIKNGNLIDNDVSDRSEFLEIEFNKDILTWENDYHFDVQESGQRVASVNYSNSDYIPVKKGDIYIIFSGPAFHKMAGVVVNNPELNLPDNVLQTKFRNPLTSYNVRDNETMFGHPFEIEADGYFFFSYQNNSSVSAKPKMYKVTNLPKIEALLREIEYEENYILSEHIGMSTSGDSEFGRIVTANAAATNRRSTYMTRVAKGEILNFEANTNTAPTIMIKKEGDKHYSLIGHTYFSFVATETIAGQVVNVNNYKLLNYVIPFDGQLIVLYLKGVMNASTNWETIPFENSLFKATISRRKDNILKPSLSKNIILDTKPKFLRVDLYGVLPTVVTMTASNYVVVRRGEDVLACGYMPTAIQGRGSAGFIKKGYTLEMVNAKGDDISFKYGDMPLTDSFHFKAFYSDGTHARDVGNGRLWYHMARNRSYPANMIHNKPEIMEPTMSNATAFDADCRFFTDGIPAEFYVDGIFWGLYTKRLKKHRSNYAMDKDDLRHIFLDAQSANLSAYLHEPFDYQDWELRNPKLPNYEGESKPIPEGVTLNYIKRFFDWGTGVFNNTIDARATYQDYIVLESWLDYVILGELIYHQDSLGNNINLVTWDGLKWSLCLYDTDATLGVRQNGQAVVEIENGLTMNRGLWGKIASVFDAELKARYVFLRDKGILSPANFINVYRDGIMSHVPQKIYAENFAKWGGFGGKILTDKQLMKCLNHRFNYINNLWGI